MPLGPEVDGGTLFYSVGGGVNLEGAYTPGKIDFLTSGLMLDISVMPINGSDMSATFVGLAPSIGMQYSPLSRLNLA